MALNRHVRKLPGALALWGAAPDRIEPMRAAAVEPRALKGVWHWEPLLRGRRAIAHVHRGKVRLVGTGGAPPGPHAPELAGHLPRAVRGDAILDGVVVGRSYQIFDCLHFEGACLTSLPIEDRRSVLRDVMTWDSRFRAVPTSASLDHLIRSGLATTGVIAKRSGSAYRSGTSQDWLQIDCAQRDDFVIGGFADTEGDHQPQALLVGQYENGRLRYVGTVARAYEDDAFARLAPTLRRLRRRTSPFGSLAPAGGRTHWVSPALVARIGFAERSEQGLLRRARFIEVCGDKEPHAIRKR